VNPNESNHVTTITDLAELRAQIGQEIAVSEWIEVTQERINRFADATDDHQWIHVDPARAARESPFKSTIAHGFLTLSLMSPMLRSAITLPKLRLAINYGCNRVRFVSPVVAGSRLRARVTPIAAEDIGGGLQVTWTITIEREHSTKPACVADWIVRYYP
jgi:acyl dehydratase